MAKGLPWGVSIYTHGEILERRKACTQRWRARNRDKVREYQRRWRAEHPDRIKKHKQKDLETHQERIKAYKKEYFQRNKERIYAKIRERKLSKPNVSQILCSGCESILKDHESTRCDWCVALEGRKLKRK